MPTTPTMLPSMRYDPDREVVLIWPQDGNQPYLVTRKAIERRFGGQRWLSPDELIDAVLAGEARDAPGFVLAHATGEIVGDAEVQRAVAATGEKVDVVDHRTQPDARKRSSTLSAPPPSFRGGAAEPGTQMARPLRRQLLDSGPPLTRRPE